MAETGEEIMCRIALLIGVSISWCLSPAGFADETPNQALVANCMSYSATGQPIARNTLCLGYVMGFVQGMQMMYLKGHSNEMPSPVAFYKAADYCPTEGVTIGQNVLIFRKYLIDHPEKLNLDPAVNLLASLNAAFPCH